MKSHLKDTITPQPGKPKQSPTNLVLAGYGSFGKVIASKMKDLEMPGIKTNFYLIAERDKEKRKAAESLGVETVGSVEELVHRIRGNKGKTVVWIATPSEEHVDHLREVLKANPSMTIVEKPLSLYKNGLKGIKGARGGWMMDLIEEQNPAVLALIDHMKEKGISVTGGDMEFYRMNSIGIKKLLDPEFRSGIEGGADLDKMVHDAGVAFFLSQKFGGKLKGYRLKKVKVPHYMPKGLEEDTLLDRRMNETKKLDKDTAVAEGEINAVIRTKGGKFNVKLVGGWLGVPEEMKPELEKLARKLGKNPIWTNRNAIGDYAFPWEELRLFRMRLDTDKGEKEFIGSMLPRGDGFFLFKKAGKRWEEIPIKEYPHDQIGRVLANAVRSSMGLERPAIGKKTSINTMKLLFKGRRKAERSRKLNSAYFLLKSAPHVRKLIGAFRGRLRTGKAAREARKTISYLNNHKIRRV